MVSVLPDPDVAVHPGRGNDDSRPVRLPVEDAETVVSRSAALSCTPMSSMAQYSCTISLGKAVEGYSVLPTAMACPRSSDQPVSVLPLTVMAKMVICANVDGWPSPSSTSW
jgi:hypothetical protein